jgi:hypothetical protein
MINGNNFFFLKKKKKKKNKKKKKKTNESTGSHVSEMNKIKWAHVGHTFQS